MNDKNFVLYGFSVVQRKAPLRPRFVSEIHNAPRAIRVDHIRRVFLRGKRIASVARFDMSVEAVDQNHSAGGRCGRGEK